MCSYDISDASAVSVWPRYQFSYWDSRECHLNPCWNNGASGSRFLMEWGLFPGAAREDRMVLDAIWRPQNKIQNYRRKFFFSQKDKSTIEAEDKPSLSGIFKEAEVVVTNVEAVEMMGQWLKLLTFLNLGPYSVNESSFIYFRLRQVQKLPMLFLLVSCECQSSSRHFQQGLWNFKICLKLW